MTGAEVLSDERCGGIAQSPGRQYGENDNANGVRGEGGRPEEAHNADQPDPARLSNQELQNSDEGYAHQPPQNCALDAQVAAENPDALCSFAETVELVED